MMENISEVNVMNAVPSREDMESLSISHSFNPEWENFQKQGYMYADTFTTHFKDDISEMFESG